MRSIRRPSELLKRGYSSDELSDIAAFGRHLLSTGENSPAEAIARGLVTVAPDFIPGWLLLSVVRSISGDVGEGVHAAKQALQIDPESVEGLLLFISGLINEKDFAAAGAYLGEVGDLVARFSGKISISSEAMRFYKVQLARYQNRV